MDGTKKKKGKGKRGIASFSKNLEPEDYYIEFDVNNQPTGKTAGMFLSWFGMMVRDRYPINKAAGKLDEKEYFKPLWLETKVLIF